MVTNFEQMKKLLLFSCFCALLFLVFDGCKNRKDSTVSRISTNSYDLAFPGEEKLEGAEFWRIKELNILNYEGSVVSNSRTKKNAGFLVLNTDRTGKMKLLDEVTDVKWDKVDDNSFKVIIGNGKNVEEYLFVVKKRKSKEQVWVSKWEKRSNGLPEKEIITVKLKKEK